MENNNDTFPEKREVFRVVYPLSERPLLKVRKNKFKVTDISEKGIKFLNTKNREFSNWVNGTITLHDNTRLDIEGKIAWTQNDEIALNLITSIPYAKILKEQQYLIMIKSRYGEENIRKRPAPKKGKIIKICLVQHGNMVSKEINSESPLSDKGREEVEKIAAFLKKIRFNTSAILHSDKLRAIQTAQILHAKIKASQGMVEKTNLAPNDPIEPLWYKMMKTQNDLMIVGHLPFLSRLASRLLSGKSEQNLIAFKQGGVVCIERDEEKIFQIAWMIAPDFF